MPRFHCPGPLHSGALLTLPPAAARHVQVLRMQPGEGLTLFDGGPGATDSVSGDGRASATGGEFEATIIRMGRSEVLVEIGAHHRVEREAAVQVHLVLGMPANDRMDWLVEKATELGMVSLQPLVTERTVLRLSGERAARKQTHWQAIAIAACEQSGRNQVPRVHGFQTFAQWISQSASATGTLTGNAEGRAARKLILSFREDSQGLSLEPGMIACDTVVVLSGPEGGLSPGEEAAALAQGFVPISLGRRVLRAETAPLALLSALTLQPQVFSSQVPETSTPKAPP
jgi:16S rRNA (uracil1498-N3)-methyltransferase